MPFANTHCVLWIPAQGRDDKSQGRDDKSQGRDDEAQGWSDKAQDWDDFESAGSIQVVIPGEDPGSSAHQSPL
jgi:hypothetical protein